jgi:hypothetical protein
VGAVAVVARELPLGKGRVFCDCGNGFGPKGP